MTEHDINTTVILRRNHAFVVTRDDIEKLAGALTGHFQSITISAQCSDAVVRRFDSHNQLVLYENPPSKRIVSLSISSHKSDMSRYYAHADIEIGQSGGRISISASEGISLRLRDKISDIFDGMKPWYSIFTKIDFTYLLIVPIFVLIALSAIASILPSRETPIDRGIGEAARLALISISIVAVSALAFWGAVWWLNRLRDRLFPVVYFALGQNENGYTTDDKLRWSTIGITATLILSVLIALATKAVGFA